jgi:cytosine/adenosine deaminase-related metal-dependent hydrolase
LIYAAEYLITLDGPPIRQGALRVHNHCISEIGTLKTLTPSSEETVRYFPDTVIMPGLINCHTHLELGFARGLFPPAETYSMWLARLFQAKKKQTQETLVDAIHLGALECIRTGTTTVFDFSNSGLSLQTLPREPLRSLAVLELSGLQPEAVNREIAKLDLFLLEPGNPGFPSNCTPGVSPHASFSCSEELIRKILEKRQDGSPPFSMHLLESAEEVEFFANQKGSLFEYYVRKGMTPPETKGLSPVKHLILKNLLPQNSLFVHCNYLDPQDVRFLEEIGASIVHCPRSTAFFKHSEIPFEFYYNNNINLCLGTESLACNDSLNLFEEMLAFRQTNPQVDCREIIRMTTLNAAHALGMSGKIGVLKSGSNADFIGINLDHDFRCDIYDEIVCEEHEVILSVINGEEVIL